MTEQDLANVVNVFAVMIGMVLSLVLGYTMGYNDAKKRFSNES